MNGSGWTRKGRAFKSIGLTRRFALLGGLIIVVASLLLAGLHGREAKDDLRVMAEHNNIALTRSFSNVIWPRFATFLRAARDLDPVALRAHLTIHELRQAVLDQMRGLPVLKVKIYDLGGSTVFSTEPSQIGQDKSGNAGFRSAREGQVASELTHRDSFSAFEQVIVDRDVLSSYVAIRSPSGQIQGVVEVYYDVTALLARIEASQHMRLLIVGATFLILYLLLVLVVWHSERQSRGQHARNLKLARAAAMAEEASRMKSDFLATMSHELRTPLNAILGFSEVIKSEMFGPGSRKYAEYAEDIWSSGRHLLDIIDDVLDLSTVESGQPILQKLELDPRRVVADSMKLASEQAREARLDLVSSFADDLPTLRADERKLKQALINLLSNAVKFTPAGGTVTTSVSRTPGGGLEFTVADTGIGIPEDSISKVLTPFGRVEDPYHRKYNGTGLGLSIAKTLVELHGATLELESEVGKGTRVRIVFPPDHLIRQPADGGRGRDAEAPLSISA